VAGGTGGVLLCCHTIRYGGGGVRVAGGVQIAAELFE